MAFDYKPHPRTTALLEHQAKPPNHNDVETYGFNDRFGLAITKRVGTMWCAYIFAIIALISLPTILKQSGFGIGFDFGNGTVILVAWVAQTFIQLVLLSIIMVGQDLQGRAGDKRADATYKDAEAVLHEATQIQAHLLEQDKAIEAIQAHIAATQPATS
jgi:hypothetical protein